MSTRLRIPWFMLCALLCLPTLCAVQVTEAWRLPSPVRAKIFAFSPDERFLARDGAFGTINLNRLDDFTFLRQLPGHNGGVFALSFSADGTLLASLGTDLVDPLAGKIETTVKLWRIADGTLLASYPADGRHLALSPDGRTIAVANNYPYTLSMLDAESGRMLYQQRCSDTPRMLAFSRSGKYLAIGCIKTINIVNSADGKLVRALTGHTEMITGIAFSPDETQIASTASDDTAKLWQVHEDRMVNFVLNRFEPKTVAFTPDGTQVAFGGLNYIVYALDSEAPPQRFKAGTVINSLMYSRDSKLLYTVDYHGLQVRDAETGESLRALQEPDIHTGYGAQVFAPDGQTFATLGRNGKYYIQRSSDGAVLREWDLHAKEPFRPANYNSLMAISPDGTRLAVMHGKDGIEIRDPNNDELQPLVKLQPDLKHKDLLVYAMAFTPDGKKLLTGGISIVTGNTGAGMIKTWQVKDGALLDTFILDNKGVNGLEISPDGRWLAACNTNTSALTLLQADGTVKQRFELRDAAGQTFAFTPDSRRLIRIARSMAPVVFYDLQTGKAGNYPGVMGYRLFLSPDGRWLLMNDGNIASLWRLPEIEKVAAIQGCESFVFSPDGKRLIGTGFDGLRAWDITQK